MSGTPSPSWSSIKELICFCSWQSPSSKASEVAAAFPTADCWYIANTDLSCETPKEHNKHANQTAIHSQFPVSSFQFVECFESQFCPFRQLAHVGTCSVSCATFSLSLCTCQCHVLPLPSGKLTVRYSKLPFLVFIVDLPIKKWWFSTGVFPGSCCFLKLQRSMWQKRGALGLLHLDLGVLHFWGGKIHI